MRSKKISKLANVSGPSYRPANTNKYKKTNLMRKIKNYYISFNNHIRNHSNFYVCLFRAMSAIKSPGDELLLRITHSDAETVKLVSGSTEC